jgi:hypothetical protein
VPALHTRKQNVTLPVTEYTEAPFYFLRAKFQNAGTGRVRCGELEMDRREWVAKAVWECGEVRRVWGGGKFERKAGRDPVA